MISIDYDQDMLARVEKKLGSMKSEAPKVLKNAVNETAKQARKDLAVAAQKNYAIKNAGFNKAMQIKMATISNPTAIIQNTGKKIGLYRFSYRKNSPGSEKYFNPTLKRTQIGKGGIGAAGKQLKSGSFSSNRGTKLKWFVAKMGSGHKGIFKRNSSSIKRGSSGEISEIMGPSIAEMIGSERRVYGVVRPNIQKNLKKNIEKQVKKVLEA